MSKISELLGAPVVLQDMVNACGVYQHNLHHDINLELSISSCCS